MPQTERPASTIKPLSARALTVVIVVILVVTGGLVALLWLTLAVGPADPVRVGTQLEVLRIGATIALGGGGGFALFLAWRRQRSTEIGLLQKERDQADTARAYALQERIALMSEVDAAARRITDLYTKAVEQLGSDKAPVRLGGLYALERLAQDHVGQRLTIIDVLCAYLRMPYTLPGDPPSDPPDDKLTDVHRERTQEREVRLAAQRILARHLDAGRDPEKPAATFWVTLDLDLTGATLIDFNLEFCTIRRARFDGATFVGDASFYEATFTIDASFNGATFTGDAEFNEATVTGIGSFKGATFTGEARFDEAAFTTAAWFHRATFTDAAQFDKVTFAGITGFSNTTFAGDTWFGGATFTGDARFDKVTFAGNTGFSGVTLPSTRHACYDTPSPYTDFSGARFELNVPPELEQFVSLPKEPIEDGGESR